MLSAAAVLRVAQAGAARVRCTAAAAPGCLLVHIALVHVELGPPKPAGTLLFTDRSIDISRVHSACTVPPHDAGTVQRCLLPTSRKHLRTVLASLDCAGQLPSGCILPVVDAGSAATIRVSSHLYRDCSRSHPAGLWHSDKCRNFTRSARAPFVIVASKPARSRPHRNAALLRALRQRRCSGLRVPCLQCSLALL